MLARPGKRPSLPGSQPNNLNHILQSYHKFPLTEKALGAFADDKAENHAFHLEGSSGSNILLVWVRTKRVLQSEKLVSSSLMLRKLPSLAIHETLWQWHSQCQRFSLLGVKPSGVGDSGWLQWADGCPAWFLTQPTLTCSQISFLTGPRFPMADVSDVSVHKAIYSQCTDTETAQAGASEQDCQQRNHRSSTFSVSLHEVLLFLLSLQLLSPLTVSIHLDGVTSLHLLCYSKGRQFPAPDVSVSVHSPGCCHPYSYSLLCYSLASSQVPTLRLHLNCPALSSLPVQLPGPDVSPSSFNLPKRQTQSLFP